MLLDAFWFVLWLQVDSGIITTWPFIEKTGFKFTNTDVTTVFTSTTICNNILQV